MIIGLVGKPSSGKSTFFKASTLAEVAIAPYPFTTIEKNEGVAFVKVECADKDFNTKCNPKFGYCINNTRFVPVRLIDVAGLVPGAHKGLGRGNEFLDDLRQADALIHVIDVSGSVNEKGEPVEPLSYDPAKDIKFLEVEIDMWYLGIIKRSWEKIARQTQQEKAQIHKVLAEQLSALKVTEEMLEELIKKLNLPAEKPLEWTEENLKNIAVELRKQTKPMIIAANKIDVPGADKNFTRLENEFLDHMLIACSAESELALREAAKKGLIDYTPGEKDFKILKPEKLNEKQKSALEFIKINVLDKFASTGIQAVLDDAVFKLLKYIAVYPVANSKLQDKDGNTLPDCHLVPSTTTALDFAFKIHTDIGNNFIRAIDLRTKQIIGKDHILKNKDVVEIVTKK